VSTKKAVITSTATAVISQRAAARLRQGHVWVYRSDVEQVAADPGSLVSVVDGRGRALGTALYSSTSQIALRIVSRQPLASRQQFLDVVKQRLEAAADYRKRFVRDSTAFRVVFGEADQLPGLVVDCYHDVLVVQFLSQGRISRIFERSLPAPWRNCFILR